MSYWQTVCSQIRLGKSDRVCSACTLSDHVGASIIIYFYMFNLMTYGLEATCSHARVAGHASVYANYQNSDEAHISPRIMCFPEHCSGKKLGPKFYH